MSDRRRAVTLCQGGNVRSVALGYILKYGQNVDCVALSWEKNSPETLAMMFDWADEIYVMQDEFKKYVPEKFSEKLTVVDVGPDRWGCSLNPELLAIAGHEYNKAVRANA